MIRSESDKIRRRNQQLSLFEDQTSFVFSLQYYAWVFRDCII